MVVWNSLTIEFLALSVGLIFLEAIDSNILALKSSPEESWDMLFIATFKICMVSFFAFKTIFQDLGFI